MDATSMVKQIGASRRELKVFGWMAGGVCSPLLSAAVESKGQRRHPGGVQAAPMIGLAFSELERTVQTRDSGERRVRRAGASWRRVADLQRAVIQTKESIQIERKETQL